MLCAEGLFGGQQELSPDGPTICQCQEAGRAHKENVVSVLPRRAPGQRF